MAGSRYRLYGFDSIQNRLEKDKIARGLTAKQRGAALRNELRTQLDTHSHLPLCTLIPDPVLSRRHVGTTCPHGIGRRPQRLDCGVALSAPVPGIARRDAFNGRPIQDQFIDLTRLTHEELQQLADSLEKAYNHADNKP